jgi:SAM-dependent methyltransferase
MENNSESDWFQVWFDSPYYPMLYNHRDDTEAVFFLNHLADYLKPEENSRILDLACGRGRHAIYLNKLGFDVTGVDLSEVSIAEASVHESDHLRFFIHDMRKLLSTNTFDYVFNLFTSFGYFKRNHENELVVKNMATCLKPGGTVVLDFLNAGRLRAMGSQTETRVIEGIVFNIKKEISGGKVIKKIHINDRGQEFHFEERVSLLGRQEFDSYFRNAGLSVQAIFGNYSLEPFELDKSDRLIYIANKL